MNEPVMAPDNGGEIDLLDLLAVLAEHWKLLLAGPLLVAVLAFGGATWWPKKYESVAIIAPGLDVHRMAGILESRSLQLRKVCTTPAGAAVVG